jgi:hypothetical protein
MTSLKLKHLNKPRFLKTIGRELLARFLQTFADDLAGNSLNLPPPELADAEFFEAVSRLLMHPDTLPDRLNEALTAIDDMAGPKAFPLFERAPDWPEIRRQIPPDFTREDSAMHLWLVNPHFLTRIHNSLRLTRLTSFEHVGHKMSADSSAAPSAARRFDALDKLATFNLTASLDAWFFRNSRGSETVRVEVFPIAGEYYFLIRHGDLYTRACKVQRQTTEVLHYRPERDDVVVYSPFLNELRVNARTQGERDLYIREFGLHLMGSADYFSNRFPYTLEPLRTHGVDSLDAREVPKVKSIRLRELETSYDRGNRHIINRAVQGLFEFATAHPEAPSPIPVEGELTRAIFEIQFLGSPKSYPVEIRLPNILKISRRCDAQAVQAWLTSRRFHRGSADSESLVVLNA